MMSDIEVTFKTNFPFYAPDRAAYEAQKKVHAIEAVSQPFPSTSQVLVESILENGTSSERWNEYYQRRLTVAMSGIRGSFISLFPGHTIPGPGTDDSVYFGGLMVERFEHIMKLAGGFPAIGPFEEFSDPPPHTLSTLPLLDWPWHSINQSPLQLLTFGRTQRVASEDERQRLLQWLRNEVMRMVMIETVPAQKLFSFIRRVWNPYAEPALYATEILLTAERLLNTFRARHHKMRHHSCLAFVFELESVLSQLMYSQRCNIEAYGSWGGCWIEIGSLPLEEIHCAELVTTERILVELVNIRKNGFAPIVVNELGSDTDGTHRLVTTWLWNLLHSVGSVVWKLDNRELHTRVQRFVKEFQPAMGPIVVRECLRVLAELLTDRKMKHVLTQEVLPYVPQYNRITRLPVLLLLEYSCGAVEKEPYDAGEAGYRVDPTIYTRLAENSSLVLPSRGPYHLTDRLLLPWIKVLFES